jgi:hypothetical protein
MSHGDSSRSRRARPTGRVGGPRPEPTPGTRSVVGARLRFPGSLWTRRRLSTPGSPTGRPRPPGRDGPRAAQGTQRRSLGEPNSHGVGFRRLGAGTPESSRIPPHDSGTRRHEVGNPQAGRLAFFFQVDRNLARSSVRRDPAEGTLKVWHQAKDKAPTRGYARVIGRDSPGSPDRTRSIEPGE